MSPSCRSKCGCCCASSRYEAFHNLKCYKVRCNVQEILEVEQLMAEEDVGMELTAENVEKSLDEIR